MEWVQVILLAVAIRPGTASLAILQGQVVATHPHHLQQIQGKKPLTLSIGILRIKYHQMPRLEANLLIPPYTWPGKHHNQLNIQGEEKCRSHLKLGEHLKSGMYMNQGVWKDPHIGKLQEPEKCQSPMIYIENHQLQ